jgi:tetratricopeptide (TPR) repeat protein
VQVLPAQTLAKNDDAKFNADYYLMRGEFGKALDLYVGILKSEPNNADIKHRIGICYLNSEDRKQLAISYLEEAVQHVSTKYDDKSFRETNAPVEAYFLLGSAYRVNNQLQEAIGAYEQYKSFLDQNDRYQRNVTDQYIESCRTAERMLARKREAEFSNLGSAINNDKPNFNAVVSADGKTLACTSPGKQGYEIWVAEKKDSSWLPAKNITVLLGNGKYLKTCGISADGTQLLLVLEDPENSEIYLSTLKKGRWSKAELLPKPVNSKYNETHASFSADGKTIWFTSNRKGGQGDLDIYRCERKGEGWGDALNMGPAVNTPYNEETPFVTADGKGLYFSSEGHKGMGGYDIFRYDLNVPDAQPLNLGYPVNTTDNNLFFVPAGDGSQGYYSRWDAQGFGGRDVYLVATPIPEPEPVEVPEVPVLLAEDSVRISDTLMVATEAAHETAIPETLTEEVTLPPAAEVTTSPATLPATPPAITREVKAEIRNEEPLETVTPEETEQYVETGPAVAKARSFEVQFMALRRPVDIAYFKNMDDIVISYKPDAWYRYTCLITADSLKAAEIRDDLVKRGFTDAFIRRKALVPHFTVQVMAVPGPVTDLTRFGDLADISASRYKDHYCRYTTGEFETREAAQTASREIREQGYPKAFVRKIRIQ